LASQPFYSSISLEEVFDFYVAENPSIRSYGYVLAGFGMNGILNEEDLREGDDNELV
jgi:hypothetical protein